MAISIKKRIVLSKVMVFALVFQLIMVSGFGFSMKALAADNPVLDLDVKSKIDVALAVAPGASADVSTFEEDLKDALATKGDVPEANIYVSAVEASEVSVEDSFDWWIYDHYNTNADATGEPYEQPYINDVTHQYVEGYQETYENNFKLKRHIIVEDGGRTMTMHGYGVPAYKDFMYMENTMATKKTFEFKINEIEAHDALDGGGFFFNTRITGKYGDASDTQRMSGYLLFLRYNGSVGQQIQLYKFENINTKDFHQGSVSVGGGGFTQLASSANYSPTDKWRTIKIEAYPNKLKMWYKGSLDEYNDPLADSELINWTLSGGGTAAEVALPEYDGTKSYGFGPMISYLSHSCERRTQFKFLNLSMSTDAVKSLTEVIRQPEWHDGTQKFIVNLNEDVVEDFNDDQKVSEIISRMNSDNIYYVGWGTNANEAQSNEFLEKHNLKGIFVNIDDTPDYNDQINAIADHILTRYSKQVGAGDAYVLISDVVTFSADNASLSNTADTEWPEGRWKVIHDTTDFDNQQGTYAYSGNYILDLDLTFEKPGKYEIYYEDALVKTVYAHEKPVAVFDVSYSGDTVSYTDNSYDPDKKNQEGKGIADYEWKYLDVTSGDIEWTEGQLTSPETDTNYIIALRVEDEYGEWSSEYTKQLYTGASVLPPVADFEISPGQILKGIGPQSVEITDKSYSPSGAAITNREWQVIRGGETVYGPSATPKTDFSDDPAGKYRIDLRVQSGGEWSETISRFLMIVVDDEDPTVVVTPAGGEGTVLEPIEVNLSFNDAGGSYLKFQRYALADNEITPIGGWSTDSSNLTRNTTLGSVGIWYIHYFAKDNAGNTLSGHAGPYQIIATIPLVTTSDQVSGITETSAVISGEVSSDGGSDVAESGLEYKKSTDEDYTRVPLSSGTGEVSVELTGLIKSTTYEYRIYAANEVGTAYGDLESFTTLAAVPDLTEAAPRQNGDVVLTIDKNGNSDAALYYVERAQQEDFSDRGEAAAWAALDAGTNTITVAGLDRDTSYYFRVKAKNGEDIETAYSETLSTLTVPPVPDKPTVTVSSNHEITIIWNDVRVESTDLTYHIYENGSPDTPVVTLGGVATETTYTHSGLTPNTLYTYTVTAENGNGVETAESASGEVATLATTPEIDSVEGQPDGNVFIYVDGKDNPADTEYYIEKSTDSTFQTAISMGADWGVLDGGKRIITGLDQGTVYYYRVKARNNNQVEGTAMEETAYGYTQASVITVPPALGEAPGVTVNSPWQVTVSWNAVQGASDYMLYRNGDFIKAVTGIQTTDVGLDPNTTVRYVVKPRNSSGVSSAPHPESGTFYTHVVRPEISLAAQADGTGVVVTIDPGDNQPGAQYQVEVSTNGGDDFSTISDKTTIWSVDLEQTISGLDSGTEYFFRARARNGNESHTSDYSDVASTFTAVAQPGKPVNSDITTDSITVSWEEVAGADSYKLYQNGRQVVQLAATTYTDEGLLSNSQYIYTVAAVNTGGTGLESAESDPVYTKAALPTSITVAGKKQDTLIFDISGSGSNDVGPQYRIVIKEKETGNTAGQTAWSTNVSNVEVTGLDNTVEYQVWLEARNEGPDTRLTTQRDNPYIGSIYANSPPKGGFQADNDGEEETSYRSYQPGFNHDFEITGKAWDPYNGEKLTISATVNGIGRSVTLDTSPTEESVEDNFTLSWDVYTLEAGEEYTDIVITIADQYGETETVTYRGVLMLDLTPPVIKYDGEAVSDDSVYIYTGEAYTQPTVTAEDNESGVEGEVTVGGDTVDTSTEGTYSVTCTAVDRAGNETTVTRTVHVASGDTSTKDDYEAVISGDDPETSLESMDDVRALMADIENNEYLSQADKEELYSLLVDMVLNSDSGITVETVLDIETLEEIIENSDKPDEGDGNKADALAELAQKATEDLTVEGRLLTEEEQQSLSSVIDGLPADHPQKDDLTSQFELETLKAAIENMEIIEDARELWDVIDASIDLEEEDKEALLTRFTERILDEGSGIAIETDGDIEMLEDAIGNSGMSGGDKQAAYEELAKKAIDDLIGGGRELTAAERTAIEGVISQIEDTDKQAALEGQIPEARTKDDFSGEIEAAVSMEDARRIVHNIQNSGLSDEDKEELLGKLADRILGLDEEGGIALESAEDVEMLVMLIEGSDIADKQTAYEELAGKALEELKGGAGKLTGAEQDAIWDVITSLEPADPDNPDDPDDPRNQLAQDFIDAAIQSAESMEDIEDIEEKIDGSGLPGDVKAALKGDLVDYVLDEENSITLDSAENVSILKELIEGSDKLEEDIQTAYEELAGKALEELKDEAGKLTGAEQDAIWDIITSLEPADPDNPDDPDDPRNQLAQDFIDAAIQSAESMEDIEDIEEKIDGSGLPGDVKAALKGDLVDYVLDGDNSITIETAGYVGTMKGLIDGSDKDGEGLQRAYEELAEKAIDDLSGQGRGSLTSAEKNAIQDVIDDITDDGKKEELEDSMDEYEPRTQEDFEEAINNIESMADVRLLAGEIENSELLTEEEIEELLGLLADRILDEDSGIAIETETDYDLLEELIEKSDMGDEEQNDAKDKLEAKKAQIGYFRLMQGDDPLPGDVTINHSEKTITVENVPYSADITSLTADIIVYESSTVTPSGSVQRNFTNQQAYTVTADDGTKKAYVVTVTKAPRSANANITGVEITHLGIPVSFTPAFTEDGMFYTASVTNSVESIRFSPDLADYASVVVKADGEVVNKASGQDYYVIGLDVGTTILEAVVTAENQTDTQTYRWTFTRAIAGVSSNTNLAVLAVSEGVMDPAFNRNITDYNLTLPNSVESVAVTASVEDATSGMVMRANGLQVANGQVFQLNVGSNVVSVEVTATGGQTKTYAIAITRETASTGGSGGSGGNSGSSGGGSGRQGSTQEDEPQSKAAITVDGSVRENAAEVRTETNTAGQTVAIVTLNEDKLRDILESLPAPGGASGTASTPARQTVIQVSVEDNADVQTGGLNGQMVKDMETKSVVLEINTERAAYTLPAQEINIDAVSKQIGKNVRLSDIKVEIGISKPSGDAVKVVEDTANRGSFILVAPPVEFNIACTHENKTVNVDRFNSYVERTIAIPAGVDATKITTGVIVDPDGTVRHVPTKVTVIDGKYYAKINSLTNSTYSVIWNPVEFTDVAAHWAKEAVNDMGSRMVISGVGGGSFDPDRDITRAEFAAIMVRALGLKPGTGINRFADVRVDAWYWDYVKTAADYGIISGYGDDRFGPDDKITREQAMAMIERAMNITGLKGEFTVGQAEKLLTAYDDIDAAEGWARASIASCVKAEIISGRDQNLIAPKANITRAEVAVAVRRLLQKSNLI